MIFYLRDSANCTIVDIEIYTKDYEEILGSYVEMGVSIDIKNYSKHLDDVKAKVRKMLEKICQSWDFLYLVTG